MASWRQPAILGGHSGRERPDADVDDRGDGEAVA